MIKTGRYVYIHFTTVMLWVVCWFCRRLEVTAVSYAVIFLHELAHLAAAAAMGLHPSRIVFFPFGVNLKLKSSIIYSLPEEIILYIAGPLSNIIMALAVLPMQKYGGLWKMFYINNIALFAFNILPVIPMDGGVIIKKLLAHTLGTRRAGQILTVSSVIVISALIIAEIFISLKTSFNYNMLIIMIFLTGNIFTEKEKYRVDFVKELMYYNYKDDFKYKKVKTYLLKDKKCCRKLAENFAQGQHYVVFSVNDGKIDEILTEKEIIEKLLM